MTSIAIRSRELWLVIATVLREDRHRRIDDYIDFFGDVKAPPARRR
ncbi:MAG TPA: hypothetical protein VMT79_16190 [Candidatus Binatia bacterium]|jgi:hypothetical protein|nr:hypothetical protein [Candidatus Binatia bacterium]